MRWFPTATNSETLWNPEATLTGVSGLGLQRLFWPCTFNKLFCHPKTFRKEGNIKHDKDNGLRSDSVSYDPC